jgi:hypothetical protein
MINQRRSNWTPVIVSNFGNPADEIFGCQASSALHPAYTDGFLGEASNDFDPKAERQSRSSFFNRGRPRACAAGGHRLRHLRSGEVNCPYSELNNRSGQRESGDGDYTMFRGALSASKARVHRKSI